MERKIGEIFEYNGEWYQCVEGTNCRECDFSSNNVTCDIHGAFKCTCKGRSDETSVVFKKLEKVGDPFIGKVHIQLQRYKIYTEPIIDPAEKIGYVNEKNTIAIEIKQTKEDMEEKNNAKHSNSEKIGKNLKPFSLEAAKLGKPVYTRDGRKARIICFDRNDLYPIVALIECEDGKEMIGAYSKEGHTEIYEIKGTDLMMLPEKKEGWVNVYMKKQNRYVKGIFPSREIALNSISEKPVEYIATIKIIWEE